MESVQSNKKLWARPSVQMLNINSDTYSGAGTQKENSGSSNQTTKKIPS